MRVWVLVLLSAAGCLEPSVRDCPNGLTCGAGLSCDTTHGLCVAAEALTACNGIMDGLDCSFGEHMGTCNQGVCLETFCGDGVKTGTEQCDDEDLGVDKNGGAVTCSDRGYYDDGPVTCNKQCRYDESKCHRYCGDGTKDPEEQCDTTVDAMHDDCTEHGFYRSGPVGCTASCVFDVSTACAGKGICGDGVPDPEESCEPGKTLPTETCFDFTYDAGRVRCSNACTPDLSLCKRIGWKRIDFGGAGSLTDIVGAGTTFIAGSSNGLAYLANQQFGILPPNGYAVNGIWGTFTDAYTAGGGGFVGHYDGMTHSTINAGAADSTKDLFGIWESSASNIYAVGWNRIWHNPPSVAGADTYTKSGWTYQDVWGASNGSIAFAIRNDQAGASNPAIDKIAPPLTVSAMTWSPSGSVPRYLASMFGISATSVYAVGDPDLIIHYDGGGSNTWTTLNENGMSTNQLRAIWGRSDTDLYAVGVGSAGWINNGSWWPVDTGVSSGMFGLTGDATDVYAAGGGLGIYRYLHASWIRHGGGALENFAMPDVWASDPDAVYVLTTNDLQQKDVVGFTSLHTGSNYAAMWRSGTAFALARSDGKVEVNVDVNNTAGWLQEAVASTNFSAIGGTSLTNLYAGTFNGQIWHRGTSGWAQETPAPIANLIALWVAPTGEVFAVGYGGGVSANGEIRRRDSGGVWHTDTASVTFNKLKAVWGTSKDNVWAAGDVGTLVHWDGATWTTMAAPIAFDLTAMGGSAANDVWAGGTNLLIRYDGVAWNQVRLPPGLENRAIERLSVRDNLVLIMISSPWELAGLARTNGW